jgi:hypothetical protein
VKIDWHPEGWRVFADTDDHRAVKPRRVIDRDISIPPITLKMGRGEEANKGWVLVPDGTEL